MSPVESLADARRSLEAHYRARTPKSRALHERALALNPGRDRIEAEDLPEEVRAGGAGADAAPELPDAGMDLPAHLQRVEASLIRTALDRTGGNKQQAARLLNIKRTTLVEKAKRIDH